MMSSMSRWGWESCRLVIGEAWRMRVRAKMNEGRGRTKTQRNIVGGIDECAIRR